MASFSRSDLGPRPAMFGRYIDEAPEGDLNQLLAASQRLEGELDLARLEPLAVRAYQPGKWTVNGVLQHMADTERIFAYRALRIARGDTTPLPGFDENLFAAHAGAEDRPFADVVAELRAVRAASVALFAGLRRAALAATGTCSGVAISAAGLGFAILGHHRHHAGVLMERYAPLSAHTRR